MKQKKTIPINLRGIERADNDITIKDGACDEIINMRLKDGAWRPLGGKIEFNNFSYISGYENFYNIYSHSILAANMYVAVSGQNIVLIDSSDSISPITYETISDIETEFEIQIEIKGDFTIESDSAWLVPSILSGSGYGSSVTITVDPSITSDRSGIITITGDNGVYECNVDQAGLTLTASTPVNVDYYEQDEVIDVTILPSDSDFTSVENPASDLVTSLSDDQGANEVTASLAENPAGSQRSGTVRISHDDFPSIYQDVVINQEAAPFTIVCDPVTLLWLAAETDKKSSSVDIVPDTTFAVNVTGDTDKFDVTLNQLTNLISVQPLQVNISGDVYQINIEVTASGYVSDNIACSQAAI